MTDYGQRSGRSWRFWAAIAAAILLILFIALNAQTVTVDFLFATAETPLVVALVISGVLGALIGWLAPRVRRD